MRACINPYIRIRMFGFGHVAHTAHTNTNALTHAHTHIRSTSVSHSRVDERSHCYMPLKRHEFRTASRIFNSINVEYTAHRPTSSWQSRWLQWPQQQQGKLTRSVLSLSPFASYFSFLAGPLCVHATRSYVQRFRSLRRRSTYVISGLVKKMCTARLCANCGGRPP